MTDTERADRAEAAVGTLQTALRQLHDQWLRQAQACEFGAETVLTGHHATIADGRAAGYRQCVSDIKALLPALDGIPHE